MSAAARNPAQAGGSGTSRAAPTVTPVLLAGGSGTRLWPLSRRSRPKQFAPLAGEASLFAAAARRLSGTGAGGPAFARPLVVTAAEFRFVVAEALAAEGIDPLAVLLEPEPRNTAPAVLAAALHALAADPEAVLLVAPSDHVVPDAAAFRAAVARGLDAAADGRLVTFGIRPDRAETGYGYLALGEAEGGTGADDPDAARPLAGFVEKPDAATAERLVAGGRHLWNAGVFLARAADLVAAFRAHAPDVVAPVEAALSGARPDLGFLRLDPAPWSRAPAISIDHAVMEKARNLSAVPYGGGWSDLGDWQAVWREAARDADGVAVSGAATAIDCRDTLLRSEAEGLELVGIGLEGMVAVAMPDAVLVAPMARAQEVRRAVEALAARGARQAAEFPRDLRPWGWFESLARGPRFQVKRIHVHPGAALSLQSHVHRAEHWVVVEGTARVTIGDEVRLVGENQSVYVPLGARHRLENPGRVPVTLIEVQTGAYLGEDDIVRYEDVYARS